MSEQPEKDAVTGEYTTGHEWDGIKELNTPLPRWWLLVFIVSIIWSIGYWIVMPAWPLISDFTEGAFGYSSREAVLEKVAAGKAAQSSYINRIAAGDLSSIQHDEDLLNFALAGGRSAFGLHCAQCHGSGAAGAPGIPNLNDDEWIWGGTLTDIDYTIRHGVRADNFDTRFNEMPAFVRDGLLSAAEAEQVADYIYSLTHSDAPASPGGAQIFDIQCLACHGEAGVGDRSLGGPSLNDAIWLYGGERDQILAQIMNPKHGMMPSWGDRLDDVTIKQLAIYVHALGGGE